MAGLLRRLRRWTTKQLLRVRLREAADDCVRHGWPVVPGAWWSHEARRHVCDIPGCLSSSLHPAAVDVGPVNPLSPPPNLGAYALHDQAEIRRRWARRPYAVLVPTGIACDAIEIPAELRAPLLRDSALASQLGPVAALDGTAFVFTTTGTEVSPAQARALRMAAVVLHRKDSWVPIPPSVAQGVSGEWLRHPDRVGWRLPAANRLVPVLLELAESNQDAQP